MLDRTSPVPLYHQISEAILAPIRNGELKPGDAILTEQELIQAFGVSRITVRRAIHELEIRGYLIRKQGLGTFVAPPDVKRGATQLKGFSEDITSRGMKPKSKLLSLRQEPATAILAQKFDIDTGDTLWFVERLRYADEKIIALNLSYLNLPVNIKLDSQMFGATASLWGIIETLGIRISDIDRAIEAIAADEYQAKLLEVEINTPLLRVESMVYSGAGTPIEVSQIIGRGDRYKFIFRSTSQNN
jgi:GntR family transcriptional regulator